MPVITLPDGSQRQFDNAVTVADVALDIGPGLAKATLAGKIGDELVDTSHLIDTDCEVSLITDKSPEGVEIVRHSTAHLMAQAVKQLFPDTQATIGPVIDNGFFYDFARDESFAPEDMAAIEQRMKELVKADTPIERSEMGRDEAIAFFKDMGEEYKAEIIADIPADQTLSLYKQGDFIDLCRGPHVPSTGKLKSFKLMKLAGAYWRGNSDNAMLQRIYGTAWTNKKDLKSYLHRLEEAEKRDHRKLGKQLNLFHSQDEAPGMVFWHNNGWIIYQEVEQYIRKKLRQHNYDEVKTPQVVDRSLWERSGHWDKFHDMM
ncbi:MAG: TGS domain-containing protein, partial [Chromatiales bacterium]|nr:TGS domain-containing protein [Chromatiales bacterium]